jgi:hypothetical protein
MADRWEHSDRRTLSESRPIPVLGRLYTWWSREVRRRGYKGALWWWIPEVGVVYKKRYNERQLFAVLVAAAFRGPRVKGRGLRAERCEVVVFYTGGESEGSWRRIKEERAMSEWMNEWMNRRGGVNEGKRERGREKENRTKVDDEQNKGENASRTWHRRRTSTIPQQWPRNGLIQGKGASFLLQYT